MALEDTYAKDYSASREKETCGCIDVGTIVDNSDCTARYQHLFARREDAAQMQETLISKARSIESEPCIIDSQVQDSDQGVELTMSFTFSCQAETLIFQLGLR